MENLKINEEELEKFLEKNPDIIGGFSYEEAKEFGLLDDPEEQNRKKEDKTDVHS